MNVDKIKPVPKIAATGFGGAVGVILVIIFDIDGVEAASLSAALGTIAGYLMPAKFPWNKGG